MADIIDMAQAREEMNLRDALRAREARAAHSSATCGISNEGGVCPDCNDPIEPERLRVIPNAVRCADCQGAHEQKQTRPK